MAMQTQNDEQQIRELVTSWMNETKKGNFDAVMGLMADDVVFLTPGQAPMIGKSAFAAAAKTQADKEQPHFDGKSEIREIKVVGDWAFMWTKLTVMVTPSAGAAATPMTRAGHTLSILRKEKGKWLLARDANLLAPVK
jgi:uncharacterized protein (TIGR02246 family)